MFLDLMRKKQKVPFWEGKLLEDYVYALGW